MKKIAVPTDFSNCASTASSLAIHLAKVNNGEVHFTHIINSGMDWAKVPKEMEKNHPDVLEEIGSSEAKLSELVRNAQAQGISATKSIAHNISGDEFGSELNANRYDLVVMGSYGANGVKKIIGSNTQHIIRNASIPTLVVKKDLDPNHIDRLVLASNFETVNEETIKTITELQKEMNCELELLYVNTPDTFIPSDVMEERFNKWKNEFRLNCSSAVVNSTSIEEGIANHCKTNDLVVVEYHKRSAIRQFFDPSITESLINYTAQSVLCIPVEEV